MRLRELLFQLVSHMIVMTMMTMTTRTLKKAKIKTITQITMKTALNNFWKGNILILIIISAHLERLSGLPYKRMFCFSYI